MTYINNNFSEVLMVCQCRQATINLAARDSLHKSHQKLMISFSMYMVWGYLL